PGMQGGPHEHIIAAKAVAFGEALKPEFKSYAGQIVKNAAVLAEALKLRGFYLITGGTSNHLILANVHKSFGVDGKIVEEALDKIGLSLNKNSVPDDTLPPFRPSGIRLGTPAMTTRGLMQKEMETVADWIKRAVDARDDEKTLAGLRQEVKSFSLKYPLPSDKR
ncbi:MAG TPA: serine hydroxymethyltransferase, partial [Candidatus Saccharimonadales bacterium]|nr:serine hydroxymethyltransferase [Candidatus Saccharimonadales bacterium]